MTIAARPDKRSALRFILALGLISLLADVTYEGARSITGPFLGSLGASAVAVGFVAGFGELAGYTLRLVSGFAADRTRSYWALTIGGYVVNLLAVPMLALANDWQVAAVLMVLERAGKAVRTPSRDVMLSQAATLTGQGWGFGLHEAMDQTGACIGPLLVAFTVARTHGYRAGFALLAVPACLAIITVIVARFVYPDPNRFETKPVGAPVHTAGLAARFWLYVFGAGLIAAGIADFALIAYHFQQAHVTGQAETPIYYAAAMGTEAVAALLFGRLFDKVGIWVVVAGVVMSMASTPLVFLGSTGAALLGMLLWGAGMGAQNSALKAGISQIVPAEKRGAAFGIFNTVYGVFWFLGSAAMGLLYGWSLIGLVAFGMASQVVSIPLLLAGRRQGA